MNLGEGFGGVDCFFYFLVWVKKEEMIEVSLKFGFVIEGVIS